MRGEVLGKVRAPGRDQILEWGKGLEKDRALRQAGADLEADQAQPSAEAPAGAVLGEGKEAEVVEAAENKLNLSETF